MIWKEIAQCLIFTWAPVQNQASKDPGHPLIRYNSWSPLIYNLEVHFMILFYMTLIYTLWSPLIYDLDIHLMISPDIWPWGTILWSSLVYDLEIHFMITPDIWPSDTLFNLNWYISLRHNLWSSLMYNLDQLGNITRVLGNNKVLKSYLSG